MFYFNGVYHMFTQQFFSWVRDWNGGIGSGHLVSSDLAHWQEIGSLTPRRGLTRLPLEGAAGATQLDLEVRFVWRGGVPPETQVGVAVLQEKGTGARTP